LEANRWGVARGDGKIEPRCSRAEAYIAGGGDEKRIGWCAGGNLEYRAIGSGVVDGEEAGTATRAVIDRDAPLVRRETGRNAGIVEEDAQIVFAQDDRVEAKSAGRRTVEADAQAAVDVEILCDRNTGRHKDDGEKRGPHRRKN